MLNLKERLMLTDDNYRDLKGAIRACTITNFTLFLPFMVLIQVFNELLKPLLGEEISWQKMWVLFGVGVLSAAIIYAANKNDYKKTFVTSYMASENNRTRIAEHIRKLPMSFFNTKDLSELTTNIMGDCTTTEHVLSHIVPQLMANAYSITFICLSLALFNWRLALGIFATMPIAFLIVYLSRKIQLSLAEKHVKAKLDVSDQVQEYLEGIKVIKSLCLDGENFEKLNKALKKMKQMSIQMEFIFGIFITGAQIVLQSGIGITVFVGTLLITKGEIDLVTMLMFMVIVVRIYGPILTELTLLPELLYMQTSNERMRTLMTTGTMEGKADVALKHFDIVFEDVSFRYNKEANPFIEHLNLNIMPNAITALVGASGSGKSTLSRLIARFWDVDEGRVTIGGVDVKTLDPEHLMSYMSFVFQDVVLFNDTVYNNIRIGNMNTTREEVVEAARAACCESFIERLPEGYDTVIGENGSTLSGGERQRISIARALLKDAPIILLDEATASLDPENEILIQQAISRLIDGKTVIVIAHRLRTISGADSIIVLENGKIAEKGNHESLIRKQGIYHKLYKIQSESLGWSVKNA